MLGSCNVILENGNRCNRNFNLNNLIFRDPYSPSFIETVDLCSYHYKELLNDVYEDIYSRQRQIQNLIAQAQTYREEGTKYGIFYDTRQIQAKIEYIKNQIQTQLNNECKNYFCHANLQKIGSNNKIYSITTFRQSGKRHHTLYFCSLKCYNIIKSRTGLKVPINSGQLSLSIGV